MGEVYRQVFKNNLLSFMGVGLGVVAQLAIYPYNVGLKGHLDTLLKAAMLIYPFLTFGMRSVMIRFQPYLEGDFDDTNAQLLTRGLLVVGVGLIITSLMLALLGDQAFSLLERNGFAFEKIAKYKWHVLGLVAVMALNNIFGGYLINLKRIAIPALFNSVLPKIGLAGLFLLFIFGYVGREGVTLCLVLLYFVMLMGTIAYIASMRKMKFRWGKLLLQEKSKKDMVSIAGYSIIGTLGSVLAIHLDTLSVNAYLGDVNTGVYSFAAFAVITMAIPYQALNNIISPMIASVWKEKKLRELERLYQESSQILFAVAGYMYTGLIVCLPYLYYISPKMEQYAAGYFSTVLLGAGILFDQVTSINNTILGYTDYYRWNVLFVLLMGGMNVVANIVFVGVLGWGLTGAAFATMASLFVYNTLKALLIYRKIGAQPFTFSIIITGLVLLAIGAVGWLIPAPEGAWLNVLARGAVVTILFYLYLRFTSGVPALRRVLTTGLKSLL